VHSLSLCSLTRQWRCTLVCKHHCALMRCASRRFVIRAPYQQRLCLRRKNASMYAHGEQEVCGIAVGEATEPGAMSAAP